MRIGGRFKRDGARYEFLGWCGPSLMRVRCLDTGQIKRLPALAGSPGDSNAAAIADLRRAFEEYAKHRQKQERQRAVAANRSKRRRAAGSRLRREAEDLIHKIPELARLAEDPDPLGSAAEPPRVGETLRSVLGRFRVEYDTSAGDEFGSITGEELTPSRWVCVCRGRARYWLGIEDDCVKLSIPSADRSPISDSQICDNGQLP
jgi:hypothetical protein